MICLQGYLAWHKYFGFYVGPIFGHVGDGNFHCSLLFDPENPAEYRACKDIASRSEMQRITKKLILQELKKV